MALLLYRLGETALEEAKFNEARQNYDDGLALALSIGDRQRIASIVEGFACLADAEHQPARALTLAGAGASLRRVIHSPLAPAEAVRFEARLTGSREALGSQAARWFDHGYGLSVSSALTLARAPAEPVVRVPAAAAARGLTAREQQVAALVARGLSNRRIADQLGVAGSTIQRHVVNIMSKRGLQSRVQLALWYVGHAPHT
jgi:DNA-binding CsgD family transcriptional regulator